MQTFDNARFARELGSAQTCFMPQATETLGSVARILGVSVTRVRQLDQQLAPIRDSAGRRLYRRDRVERYAAQRDARAGK